MSSAPPCIKPSPAIQQVPWPSEQTFLWVIVIGSFAMACLVALIPLVRHFDSPEPAEIRVVLGRSKRSSKRCANRARTNTLTRIRNRPEHESSTASTDSTREPPSIEKKVHRPAISRHTTHKNSSGSNSQHAMKYMDSALSQSPSFSRLGVNNNECPVLCEHYAMSTSSLSRIPSSQSDISCRTKISSYQDSGLEQALHGTRGGQEALYIQRPSAKLWSSIKGMGLERANASHFTNTKSNISKMYYWMMKAAVVA